jgi:16S rRNA (cytidine1402-2'-O)-methyltransferase
VGTLYVIATPIGNLEDITLRALRVLGEVALVAAEDTRTTRGLLRHYEIATPVTSFHDFTGEGKTQRLVERIQRGEDIALVSEAGMPAISDPGFPLIREAIRAGCVVTCVPGPSAVETALVLSGLPTHAYHYIGFLPRKSGERRRVLAARSEARETLVCFESPHRLLATLRDAMDVLGAERPMAAARELTKRFEEVVRGSIHEVLAHFERAGCRGEFTLVFGGLAEP